MDQKLTPPGSFPTFPTPSEPAKIRLSDKILENLKEPATRKIYPSVYHGDSYSAPPPARLAGIRRNGVPLHKPDRALINSADFVAELTDIGIPTDDKQLILFNTKWNTNNFGHLREFLLNYRRHRDPIDKKLLFEEISEIIKDINTIYDTNVPVGIGSRQNIVNRLTQLGIFITKKEKPTFYWKWGQEDYDKVLRNIVDYETYYSGFNEGLSLLIRDQILSTSRRIERKEQEELVKEISAPDYYVYEADSGFKESQEKKKQLDYGEKRLSNKEIAALKQAINELDTVAKNKKANDIFYQAYEEPSDNYTMWANSLDDIAPWGNDLLIKVSEDDINITKGVGAKGPMGVTGPPITPYWVQAGQAAEGVVGPENKYLQEAKSAGVRVAAKQANKIVVKAITSAVPSSEELLTSDLGSSFVSMTTGLVLTYAMKENELAQKMAKEFRVAGMAGAGNFVVDELLEMIAGVAEVVMAEELPEEEMMVEEAAEKDKEASV